MRPEQSRAVSFVLHSKARSDGDREVAAPFIIRRKTYIVGPQELTAKAWSDRPGSLRGPVS